MTEWISVEEKTPDVFAGKFRVKMKDGSETDAFFYSDGIAWIAFYGQKTSKWWSADRKTNHERLDDVTHWKEIYKPLE